MSNRISASIRTWFSVAVACSAIAATFVRADEVPSTQPLVAVAPTSTDFLRFVDHGATGSKLETADVAYRNAAGVTVHLVAAVHVAEKEYFEGLNQSFKLRDAVLYEMVKPKGTGTPEPGAPSKSMIGQVQHMMKDVLGLDFQLDDVNYAAPNFVHADMDAETFKKMQDERGEGFGMMFLQQMIKAFNQPKPSDDQAAKKLDDSQDQLEDLIRMFTRPDGERQMKLRFAKQLADMENSPMGPDALNGSVLLTERNKAAFAVLDKTLADGKRDIAIFYGAAHMPDMSTRLQAMGFKPIATEWRMAWDLSIRADKPSELEKLLIDAVKDLGNDGGN